MQRRAFIAATTALLASSRWPAATAESPQVILFQGDSITDSGRNRTAAEPNTAAALGTGYPLLVAAAALAAHPERGLRFFNRGVSGNTVPDLQQRWDVDTLELRPDVLSILIGVNDFWHTLGGGYTGTVQDYEDQYAALLERTRRALPRVRLVVLEPFVLRCGAVDDRWFPEFDARRAAAARVAQHARATFVPLQAVFDARARTVPPQYWAADGVHPTPAGHAVIAERWRRAAHL
jgi:lysophospholipase L1-like esterase